MQKLNQTIFIGGFSCRLPESGSPEEFWEHLVQTHDLVSCDSRRWEPGIYPTPDRFGKLKDIEHFDAQFFEVHAMQARKMDPQLRLLLEVSYEAVLDAGFNLETLKGQRTGVFVGACYSDADKNYSHSHEKITGYENTGCAASMFSNRLSYTFDFDGPSLTIDTACSSSLVAFDAAVKAIDRGECDHCLVCGTSMILNPAISIGFNKLQMLSADGKCRSFDNAANGYVRAEGIIAVFLSRSDRSRKNIAEVIASGTNNDGFKPIGITYPSSNKQKELLECLYDGHGINRDDVVYIEAHGTGTRAGDPQELNTLDHVFGKTRKPQTPLLVGSVKSNMGHAEGAAGLAGMVKVLLAMQNRVLPPNLHYYEPNEDIPALKEGRLKVVTELTEWNGGIVGVSSFGFGGSNAHIILRGGIQTDSTTISQTNALTHSLIPLSSRTLSGLEQNIEYAKEYTQTEHTAGFYRSIANVSPKRQPYRGFLLLSKTGESHIETSQTAIQRRPVWFVYSGQGAQWPLMGADLLDKAYRIDTFRNSIEKCRAALLSENLDILALLQQSNGQAYDDPVNSFTALTAIQLALTDILKTVEITPDGLLGHSFGEIACAYADCALTIEQAIRIAYWRGKSIKACVKNPHGQMAVIAMTWEQAKNECPNGIVPACHNAQNSVTVSGDQDKVLKFVERQTQQGIDVRLINTGNIAFHSPLIEPAYPMFKQVLQTILPQPEVRSKRWISSSRIESDISTERLCDTDYFADNMLNPVLFYEAVKHIPQNAVVIEISAHTLLHAILRESLPDAVLTGMMRRDHDNQSELLCGLGRCYINGIDVKWDKLFPVHFPLTNNDRIPALVSWDHTTSWEVPKPPRKIEYSYIIDTASDEHRFLLDHKVNGQTLYPATAYIYIAWQTIAGYYQLPVSQCPIEFKDIKIHRPTILHEQTPIELKVRFLSASNRFEISENDSLVVSGTARTGSVTENKGPAFCSPEINHDNHSIQIESDDFYKELHLRGYDYGPHFRLVKCISTESEIATVTWNGNWISYLDNLLQTSLLSCPRHTFVPTDIGRLAIYPQRQTDTDTTVLGNIYRNTIYSSAVEIERIQITALPRKDEENSPVLMKYEFIPNNETRNEDTEWNTAARYANALNAYISRRFSQLTESELYQDLKRPTHVGMIETLLKNTKLPTITDQQIDELMEHPQALCLRLARHIYDHVDQLCADAGRLIRSFEDYANLYERDLLFRQLLQNRYLKNCVDLVYENNTRQKPLLIGAVDNGTDGFNRILQSLLYSQEHQFTVGSLNQPFTVPGQDKLNLVVASNVLHRCKNIRLAIRNIRETLSDTGFFLLHEVTHGFPWWLGIWGHVPELWNITDSPDRANGFLLSLENWCTLLQEEGFNLVSTKDDAIGFTLFLARKTIRKPNVFITFNGNELNTSLATVRQNLNETAHNSESRLWIEGKLSESPGLLGLVNCIRQEPNGDSLRCVLLNDKEPLTSSERDQLLARDLVINVHKNGEWGTYRHSPMMQATDRPLEHARAALQRTGDLASFYWQTIPPRHAGMMSIKVCYSALNFKDVMEATGKLRKEIPDSGKRGVCFEFSGITEDGNRVMGIADNALATDIQYDLSRCALWNIPAHWTLADAATVPVVYATAYLALVYSARIGQGQSILIHSGSGGVGQAAIRIALSLGCEVFTTVGNNEKKEYLLKTFSELAADHIGDSRSLQFESMVLEKTAGRGVDVVLNSLADDKLQASLRLLAEHGHFVEIGRYDMTIDQPVGMRHFLRGITFHGIQLDAVIRHKPELFKKIHHLVSDGIEQGVVQPLDRMIFNRNQLEEAFRYMAQGHHKGKVLIQIRDETKQTILQIDGKTTFHASPEKTYLITGGLGGIGLQLVNWLVECGAKHFVLTSRNGANTNYKSWQLARWKKQDIHVDISTLDVGVETEARELIAEITSQNEIAGIFHLAMILDDALFSNQTIEQFQKVLHTKLDGAVNLDKLTRELCPELEHFVMFSSLSGAFGNTGQSNYGYANSGLDKLCDNRKAQGLPALSIQWGIIGDVGIAENLLSNDESAAGLMLKNLPVEKQSIRSALATLNELLLQDHPVIASYMPKRNVNGSAEKGTGAKRTKEDLKLMILKIMGARDLAGDFLNIPFRELGLDSLMGVEIYQNLDRDFGIRMTINEMENITIQQLIDRFDSVTESNDTIVTTDS